jgi:hypothetical protein
MNKYFCKKCKIKISRTGHDGSGLCRSCSCKERYQNPENHPRHIDGKCLEIRYCIDCNKKLSKHAVYHDSKRCNSCANIEIMKSIKVRNKLSIAHKGKKLSNETKKKMSNNSASYIDGRTLEKHYCIDCEELLNNYSATRCKSCANKGKNNPMFGKVFELAGNWQGGISFELYPFEFNNTLKVFIRDRDNHECQLCHTKEINLDRALDVHHIDYDKKNCLQKNLISLCLKCHMKTNTNRDYWFAYFTYIMET